jgi:hypothetical protein
MTNNHQRRDHNDPDFTSDDHNDLDFATSDLPDDYPDVIEGLKELAELRALEERRRATFRIV